MTYFHTGSKLAALTLLALAVPATASAAEPAGGPRAAAFQGFLDCKTRTEAAARLACYDAAAAALGGAEQRGDIVVVDREQARAVRRQAFGFSMPSLSLFSKGEKPEEADRVAAVVDNAYRNSEGKWVFELDDGAVWTQVDSEPMARSPKKGSKVEIRQAAMGSFFLNSDGQRALRARRVK
jgi:hypothetical protein